MVCQLDRSLRCVGTKKIGISDVYKKPWTHSNTMCFSLEEKIGNLQPKSAHYDFDIMYFYGTGPYFHWMVKRIGRKHLCHVYVISQATSWFLERKAYLLNIRIM